MVKKILLLLIAAFLITNLNSIANAQADSLRITTDNPNYEVLQDITPSNYIRTAINLILGGAGVVSFIFILIGGIRWITAGGDKDGSNNARKIILHAVTGLAIVFSSYALLYTFRYLFNVDLISMSVSEIGSNPGSSSSSSTSTVCTDSSCYTDIPEGMCPCGGESLSLCASLGDIGPIGYVGSDCYVCTNSGWQPTGTNDCDVLHTCVSCN